MPGNERESPGSTGYYFLRKRLRKKLNPLMENVKTFRMLQDGRSRQWMYF